MTAVFTLLIHRVVRLTLSRKGSKMVNLYWKNDSIVKDIEEKPFSNEAEFEKFIFDNQNILGGDISIIYRQIRSGSKDGIPDMIGILPRSGATRRRSW